MNANHVFSIVEACMSTTNNIVNTIMSQANDYAKYKMSQMTATNRDLKRVRIIEQLQWDRNKIHSLQQRHHGRELKRFTLTKPIQSMTLAISTGMDAQAAASNGHQPAAFGK